jgi:hypothetical protein
VQGEQAKRPTGRKLLLVQAALAEKKQLEPEPDF